MSNNEKRNLKIDKSNEPRKKGISRMIDEGGLGSEKYYEIKKDPPKNGFDGQSQKVFKDDEN